MKQSDKLRDVTEMQKTELKIFTRLMSVSSQREKALKLLRDRSQQEKLGLVINSPSIDNKSKPNFSSTVRKLIYIALASIVNRVNPNLEKLTHNSPC